jgi:hypothetical protein
MDLGKAEQSGTTVRFSALPYCELRVWFQRVPAEGVSHEDIADEIALRMNAHEGLVEALKDAVPYIAGSYECAFPDEPENERVLQQAKAALAQLEGK